MPEVVYSMEKMLYNLEAIPLSMQCLRSSTNRPNEIAVMYYDDFAKKSIIDVLRKKKMIIVLIFAKVGGHEEQGHFFVIYRKGKRDVTIWDPYALGFRKRLLSATNNDDLITEQLESHGYHIHENKHACQKRDNHTFTCGRFCIARCQFYEFSDKQFYHFVNSVPCMDADEFVTMLTWSTSVGDKDGKGLTGAYFQKHLHGKFKKR